MDLGPGPSAPTPGWGVIDDGDGVAPLNQERITYEFSNNTLRRCLYEGTGSENWQTLIKNVSALVFTYRDASGFIISVPVSAANLPNIKTVEISMEVEGEDVRGEPFWRTLSTRISGRNL